MRITQIAKLVAAVAFATPLGSSIGLAKEPDYKTPPGIINPVMEGEDAKGRSYEFYNGSYALLIGESHYRPESSLSELYNIGPELTNLGKTLERQGFAVTTYFDLDSKELQPTIEKFMRDYGYQHPNSRILVYFSGHGTFHDYKIQKSDGTFAYFKRKGYVLPIGIPNPKTENFVKLALPLSQFVEWAKAIEVKHALFIFDNCYSGAIQNSTKSPGGLNNAH